MNRLGKIIALISCMLSLAAAGQSLITLLSAADSSAVADANISWKNTVWTTDGSGRVPKGLPFGERVKISHISFVDTSVVIQKTAEQVVYLRPGSNELSGVTISDKPYAVFAPEKEHVFDYCFRGDTLLVLTYEKERMMRKSDEQSDEMYIGCALIVVSPSGNVLERLPLPDYTTGFHQSGITFVLGVNFCKVLQWNEGKPFFQKADLGEFNERIRPVKAILKNQVYYDDFRWHYPEFTLYKYDVSAEEKTSIRTICDEFTMELFRASYRHLRNRDKLRAWRKEIETGIDREIHAGYMAGFQNNIFYQPLYAPLFVLQDTLYIFDHYSDFLYRHSASGGVLDSVPISHHRENGLKFSDKIVKDAAQKCFWAVYQRSGKSILRAIDPTNGEVGKSHTIYHTFPDNIQVNSGNIYYIFRRTGGRKTKHLFRERMD